MIQSLTQGAVATASPEASQTGMDILRQGGNAADAAIAISLVLGVTEPAMSGLGGGSQVILSLPGQKPISINGTTLAPALTDSTIAKKDLDYFKKSTIPSTLKVLNYLFEKYGSGKLTWNQLCQPAIKYAEEGFEVGPFRHLVYIKHEQELLKSPYFVSPLLVDGRIPKEGEIVKQTKLANTLRIIAEKGVSEFYHGSLAKIIDQEMTKNEGWIRYEDLDQFPEPVELEPLHYNYHGRDVYTQPPPCGGWTVIKILQNLSNHSSEELQYRNEHRQQHVIQALYTAHELRRNEPINDLVNYQVEIEDRIHENGETTHFSVVDAQGMALGMTSSINAYFGTRAMSDSLGFLFNTYMEDFEFGEPKHPYNIHAGKMAYSSMSPTIVQENDKTILVLGSPGSARIISSVAQVAQLFIDTEMDLDEINRLPRLHTNRNKVYIEGEPNASTIQFIAAAKMELDTPSVDLMIGNLNPYYGGIHAVGYKNGNWQASADVRRDGVAYMR